MLSDFQKSKKEEEWKLEEGSLGLMMYKKSRFGTAVTRLTLPDGLTQLTLALGEIVKK